MKHRLFYRFAIVPILVVVVGSSCVGVLSLLLPQPVAQAAGNGNSCSPLSPTLPSSPLNPSCPIPSGGSAASTIPVTIGPWQNVAFTFTDRANISVTSSSFGTVDFVDKDIGDNNYNYAPTSGPFCNKQGITIPSTPNWSDPNISANLTLGNQTGNKCNKVTSNDISVTHRMPIPDSRQPRLFCNGTVITFLRSTASAQLQPIHQVPVRPGYI